MPKVTVAMPVYNDGAYLREAIDSILVQTFKDFELLIVDDGSTDDSAAIIASYKDKRIRVLQHKKNYGRPYARNTALNAAESKYFAWMDSDDIALPQRLQAQIDFMETHTSVSICGAWVQCFGELNAVWKPPSKSEEITAYTVFGAAICNPTACFRLEDINRQCIRYDRTLKRAQDFAFWGDLLLGAHLTAVNIPQILLHYRFFQRPTSSKWHTEALLSHIFPHLELATNTQMACLHTDLIYQSTQVLVENYSLKKILGWLNTVWQACDKLPEGIRKFCRIMLRNHAERVLAVVPSLGNSWNLWQQTEPGAYWSRSLTLARILLRKAQNVIHSR